MDEAGHKDGTEQKEGTVSGCIHQDRELQGINVIAIHCWFGGGVVMNVFLVGFVVVLLYACVY